MPLWIDPRPPRHCTITIGAAVTPPSAPPHLALRLTNGEGEVVAIFTTVHAAVEWWVDFGSPDDYLEGLTCAHWLVPHQPPLMSELAAVAATGDA